MSRLVLTVVGDDRAGLVRALSDIVVGHAGNWEESQLADLAGQFAGIVVVDVPEARLAEFTAAIGGLRGLLDVTPHPVPEEGAKPTDLGTGPSITLHILGDDRPGIIHEIANALAGLGASIARMESRTRPAPESGGILFEVDLSARLPEGTEPEQARAALERLAAEILVDISVDDA